MPLTIKNVLKKFRNDFLKDRNCGDRECMCSERCFHGTETEFTQFLKDNLTLMLESLEKDINLKTSGYLLMSGQVDEDEISGYEKCRQEVINIINSHR